MAPDRIAILRAWWATHRRRPRLRTRADIERLQVAGWARMAPALRATPALREFAGRPLSDLPVVSAAEVRGEFGRRNAAGLSEADARRAATDAETGGSGLLAGGMVAGFSTGSLGPPGLFLASRAERADYVGKALATLLPGSILKSWRIALVLRADSALYRGVEQAGRFRFRFWGLGEGNASRAAAIATFDPHLLIAPAHVLADLARRAEADGLRLPALRRVLAGAEPLGAGERSWIAGALQAPVDPIYQATEGFIGASCRRGTLHLNEDWMIIEEEPLGRGRFSPILTDLARTTQPVVRQRLDDVLFRRESPCPCGSPLLAIERVEGRVADIWRFGDVSVFPGEVEDAVERALGPRSQWSAAQVSGGGVEVWVPEAEAAARAVSELLSSVGVQAPISCEHAPPPAPMLKRRRVQVKH